MTEDERTENGCFVSEAQTGVKAAFVRLLKRIRGRILSGECAAAKKSGLATFGEFASNEAKPKHGKVIECKVRSS